MFTKTKDPLQMRVLKYQPTDSDLSNPYTALEIEQMVVEAHTCPDTGYPGRVTDERFQAMLLELAKLPENEAEIFVRDMDEEMEAQAREAYADCCDDEDDEADKDEQDYPEDPYWSREEDDEERAFWAKKKHDPFKTLFMVPA